MGTQLGKSHTLQTTSIDFAKFTGEALLSDDAVQTAIKAANRILSEAAEKPAGNSKRVSELKAEIANLTDAIAGGALKSSRALAARLATLQQQLSNMHDMLEINGAANRGEARTVR